MTTTTDFTVTPDEAKRLITEASWLEHQHGCDYCDHVCDGQGEPRRVIHTVTGFGCDLDLDSALAEVDKATEIRWVWSMLSHNLAVCRPIGDGDNTGWIGFEVKAPADIYEALVRNLVKNP